MYVYMRDVFCFFPTATVCRVQHNHLYIDGTAIEAAGFKYAVGGCLSCCVFV